MFAVVFLVYIAFAVLSWESFGATIGPAFFPSAGVTVAAMLLTRRALWPAVVLAIVLGELLVDLYYGESLITAAGYVTANVVEPLIGASLVLAWCGGSPDLRRRRDLTAFLGGACLIAPMLGGLIGGWVTARTNDGTWPADVAHWAAGDGIGVLVMAAPILLWPRQSGLLRSRCGETIVMLAATAAVSFVAFATELPPALLILPVLAWGAFRLNMIGASLAGVVIAFIANLLTRHGYGLLRDSGLPAPTRLALTQVFIAVIVVVGLLIAQEVWGRSVAVQARESERRERLRLEALSGLAQQFSAALTPADIGKALADRVLNDAGATAANLGLLSADGRVLEWVVMEGYPAGVIDEYAGGVAMSERTVATDSVRNRRPTLIYSAAEYAERYRSKVLWLELSGAQTVVGWPLTAGGQPIGALLLAWTERQPLNASQLSYIAAVATMVEQALVRARIYSDEYARAKVLQSAVLPGGPGDVIGMDVCVTYEPADVVRGLGGDWYDVMRLPHDRTYLAVGDVVGHGLQAVEDMAQLRSAGRAMAHQGLSPAQLLGELNGFTRHASKGKFATMSVAVFDPDSATLTYGSAGHPPPLLRRAATGEVIRLSEAGGPVLGPLDDVSYIEGCLHIEPGDILVLYTDGLVERRGMDLEAGIARAQHHIAGWDTGNAMAGRCELLGQSLAPRPRADDICIIAVRFAGQSAVVSDASAAASAG